MKTITALLFCLAPLLSLARIGDTLEQAEKRYGKPIKEEFTMMDGQRVRIRHYSNKTFEFSEAYLMSPMKIEVAHFQFVQKPLGENRFSRPKFTKDEFESVAKVNGQGKEWRKCSMKDITITGIETVDGKITATMPFMDDSVTIMTEDFIQLSRREAARKAKEDAEKNL